MSSTTAAGFYSSAASNKLGQIARVVLVGSGKGGVGKSLVACGLAVALAGDGERVGLFDIDLHGASIPNYLGIQPPLKSSKDGLEPKVVRGIKVMSVALLTGANPVPLRGEGKEELIVRMFALTRWGHLDYLVVDLPPSTSDELFGAFRLFGRKAALILVTTPSKGAVEVVSKVRKLATSEGTRVLGVVVNMASMRERNGDQFPFGRPNPKAIGRSLESKVLVQVPLDPAVNSGGLLDALERRGGFSAAFKKLARLV